MIKNQPILCSEEAPDEQLQNFEYRLLPFTKSESKRQIQNVRLATDQSGVQGKQLFMDTEAGQKMQFIQYFHLRKFVKKIMASRNLIKYFDKYHFEAINDKGSHFNLAILKSNALQMNSLAHAIMEIKKVNTQMFTQTTRLYYKLQDCIQDCLEAIPLIHPESKVKFYWDMLILLSRMYFMFTIPLDLAWSDVQFLYDVLLVPTILCLSLLIADLVFSCFQSYYQDGQLIKSRGRIFLHVLGRAYGIEFISICLQLTFLILTHNYGYRVDLNQDYYYLLLLLTSVQFKNITAIKAQMEDALNPSQAVASLVELIKLFLLLIYVIHLFSCLWFWTGSFSEKQYGASWLSQKEQIETPFGQQYLYSFYYSTVTMFTVGYGDITPQAIPEIIVSIIFMLVCSIQLSYSVNTVGGIIDKITSGKSEKQKKFHLINNYMDRKKIGFDLQHQIRTYLNYYWDKESEQENKQQAEIIDQLSKNLQDQLLFEANQKVLENCTLFQQHFSQDFKNKLIKKIKTRELQPETIIDFGKLTKHKTDNVCMCFIETGNIDVFYQNETNQSKVARITQLKPGEAFGIYGFLIGSHPMERFKTVGFTTVQILLRRDFIQLIQDYPEDYEEFRLLTDDITLNTQYNIFPIKCYSCGSQNHRVINCPLLHFNADREKVLKQENFGKKQKRKEFIRNPIRNKQLLSSRQDIKIVQDQAVVIQNMYPRECQIYESPEDMKAAQVEKLAQMYVMPKKGKHKSKKSKPSDQGASMAIRKFRLGVRCVQIANFWKKISQKQPFSEENLQKLILNDIKFRQEKLDHLHQHGLSEQIFSDNNYGLMIYKSILEDEKIEDFESVYQFKIYKPEGNSDVYEQRFNFIVDHKSIFKRIKFVRDRLIKYLLYPQLYISKYKENFPKEDYIIESAKVERETHKSRSAIFDQMKKHRMSHLQHKKKRHDTVNRK